MATTVAGQNPLNEPRIATITHLAVFEAVNAITGKYEPYLGTVTAPERASRRPRPWWRRTTCWSTICRRTP